jgi:hypothetical protein
MNFKQKVEEEAHLYGYKDAFIRSKELVIDDDAIVKRSYKAGADFAARLIVEMLHNEKLEVSDSMIANIYCCAAEFIQKEIEREK